MSYIFNHFLIFQQIRKISEFLIENNEISVLFSILYYLLSLKVNFISNLLFILFILYIKINALFEIIHTIEDKSSSY